MIMNTNKQTLPTTLNQLQTKTKQTKTEYTCIPKTHNSNQFFCSNKTNTHEKLIEYLFPWDRTVANDDDCVCVVHIYLFICIII